MRTLNAASRALLERLQHIQTVFTRADVSGSGSLDEGEFLAAFKGT